MPNAQAFTSKPIYLECVTLDDHADGPVALRLDLTQAFIDQICSAGSQLKAGGFECGEITNPDLVPKVEFWDEYGLSFDTLHINTLGEFKLRGQDQINVWTETRWASATDLRNALASPHPVEIGPLSSYSNAEFIRELREQADSIEEHIEALERAYPAPDAQAKESHPIMGMAFQISSDDVAAVLQTHILDIANADGIPVETIAEREFDQLNFFAIEKAALYGNDLDTQTTYAHEEILRQLREKGVLEMPREASAPHAPTNG